MLKNFFKTALRNILKHKAYSVINFIGLTCGMTLSLLIFSYVRNELSFDRFHKNADRLYRLNYTVPNGLKLALTPPPIAPLMTDFFPAVENAARMYSRNVSISHREGQQVESFEETDILFADSVILKMFSFEFISGNPKNALRDPFTVLITDEMAKKYFGANDPLGESLILGGNHPFKIAGVVRNFPENSHLRFHMLIPYDNMYDLESDAGAERMRRNLATNFVISHSYTYVLLKPGGSPESVNVSMPAFLKKFCPPNRQIGQIFDLMPITDIHLKSTLQAEPSSTNSLSTLFIFAAAGFLTLLIACINYINLSTAQSFTRIKEIGIRKILGSAKGQLIIQFVAESFLFCAIALMLSLGAFYLTLPLLNQFTGQHLIFFEVMDRQLMAVTLVILVTVTILAGGYPSYFVSRFDSVSSLKGDGGNNLNGSQWLRKGLVIFQLTIACVLLSGSLMLIKQLNYLKDLPLGFQKDHVISVSLFSQNMNGIFGGADSAFRSRLQTFRDRVETEAGVEQTSVSSASPGLGAIYRGVIPEGFSQEDNLFAANLSIDYDFVKTFGIQIASGRSLSKDFGTDALQGFLINEKAVNEFKWGTPERAIGKSINREGKIGRVVGVVKDFNMESLTTPVSALILEINPSQYNTLSIRIRNQKVGGVMDMLRNEWTRLFPEKTFEANFLDVQLDQQYSNFQNFGKIIQCFALIAILISCLGVYGLVLFVVTHKVKEIGVRKVLGASTFGILQLIYREFVWLTLAGFFLAIPFSYYLILQWLQNFTFHANIDGMTYLISFAMVSLVIISTISYHALKASMANPVESLRMD